MLVKASIAGAIVSNTLFALGASFFLATIALLVPSTIAKVDSAATAFTNKLSAGLAVLLILTYGLGMVFSLKTHRDFFGSAAHEDSGEAPWPISLALATLAGVTVLVAVVAGLAVLVSAQIAGSAEPCCFANDRYEGTCKVIPGKGETCQSILAYLNDPMSTGKSYCRRRLGPWQPGPGGLQDGKIQYPAGRGRVHTQSPEACTGTPHY
jgi:hypothetical protein